MLSRLIDFFKAHQITAFFTSLTEGGSALEQSEVGISSLMDTWILLRHIESNGERNRGIWVLKSRGMAHSNQIREFVFTDHGIELVDVYLGSAGVLTGTATGCSRGPRKGGSALAPAGPRTEAAQPGAQEEGARSQNCRFARRV